MSPSPRSTLFWLTRPKADLSARDQRFEFVFLQRSVCCELDFAKHSDQR
jgi:hypothetical protein